MPSSGSFRNCSSALRVDSSASAYVVARYWLRLACTCPAASVGRTRRPPSLLSGSVAPHECRCVAPMRGPMIDHGPRLPYREGLTGRSGGRIGGGLSDTELQPDVGDADGILLGYEPEIDAALFRSETGVDVEDTCLAVPVL